MGTATTIHTQLADLVNQRDLHSVNPQNQNKLAYNCRKYDPMGFLHDGFASVPFYTYCDVERTEEDVKVNIGWQLDVGG